MSEVTEFDFKTQAKKIIGIGKNYKLPTQERPKFNEDDHIMIFAKPSTSILYETDGPIRIPRGWGKINHEVELGLVIGKTGKHIKESEALDYVMGYFLLLDMTAAMDFSQYSMLLIKGFDTSLPLSKFIPKSKIADPDNIDLELKVNGELRHQSNTNQMIYNCSQLIAYLSKYFTLEEGDLILTGTPPGIAAVKDGDVMEAKLGSDLMNIKFNVIEEK